MDIDVCTCCKRMSANSQQESRFPIITLSCITHLCSLLHRDMGLPDTFKSKQNFPDEDTVNCEDYPPVMQMGNQYQNQQYINCYPNAYSLHVDTSLNIEPGNFGNSQPQQNIPGNFPQENMENQYQNQQDMNCYPNSQFINFNQGCIALPKAFPLHVDTSLNNKPGNFSICQPQQNIQCYFPQEDSPEDEEQSSDSDSSYSKEKSEGRYIKWNVGLPKPVLPDYKYFKDIKKVVSGNKKVSIGELNKTYSIIPLYSYEQWNIFKVTEETDRVHCLYCNHDYDNQPSDVRDHLQSGKHCKAVCFFYYLKNKKYPGCIDTSYDEKTISDAIFPARYSKILKAEEKERYVQWLKDNHIINFYTYKLTLLTRVQLEERNTSKSPTSSNSSSTLPH